MRPGKLLQRLVQVLRVKDMAGALAFYRALGFALAACHPDQQRASRAEVVRDGSAIQFHTEPPFGTPPSPIFSGTFYFFPKMLRHWRQNCAGRRSSRGVPK